MNDTSPIEELAQVCSQINAALASSVLILPEREEEITSLMKSISSLELSQTDLSAAQEIIAEAAGKQEGYRKEVADQTKEIFAHLQKTQEEWRQEKEAFEKEMKALDDEEELIKVQMQMEAKNEPESTSSEK